MMWRNATSGQCSGKRKSCARVPSYVCLLLPPPQGPVGSNLQASRTNPNLKRRLRAAPATQSQVRQLLCCLTSGSPALPDGFLPCPNHTSQPHFLCPEVSNSVALPAKDSSLAFSCQALAPATSGSRAPSLLCLGTWQHMEHPRLWEPSHHGRAPVRSSCPVPCMSWTFCISPQHCPQLRK